MEEFNKLVKDDAEISYGLKLGAVRIAKVLYPSIQKLNEVVEVLKPLDEKADKSQEEKEQFEVLKKQLQEIYDTEIQVPLIDVQSITDKLSVQQLANLDPMFV